MAKLSAIALAAVNTSLEIAGLTWEPREDGSRTAILTLKKPIEQVTGSQSITDVESATSEKVRAYDVMEVKVSEDNQDDDGFDLDEVTGAGTYKGNLRLDVAKSSNDVWLVSTTFAAFGRAKRTENQNNRATGMLAKMSERRAIALANRTVGGNSTPVTGSVPASSETVMATNP